MAQASPVESPFIASSDLSGLSMSELDGVIDAFEAARRRALAIEMDAISLRLALAGDSARFGDLACGLVDRQKVSTRDARHRESVARQWHRMPLTAQALRDGEISFDHVVALARAAKEHPVRFESDEGELVSEAVRRTAGGFVVVVNRWIKVNDPDNGDSRDTAARRRARVDKVDAGADMVGFYVELANLEGSQAWAALEAEARRLWKGDHPLYDDDGFDPAADTPSAANYRAAAVHRLLCGETSGRRGVGVQVVVVATIDDIEHRRGGELLDGTQISGAVLAQVLCDAPVTGMIFGRQGEVLWKGRNVRLATTAQRLAVKVRDRHCTFPGCDQHADRCDAHHLVEYADGGATDVDNLILLCRRHHTYIHAHGWTFTGSPGHDLTWQPPATRAGTADAPDGFRRPGDTPPRAPPGATAA